MGCPCFEDRRLARCSAVSGVLIPTHYERERYCRTDEHEACPTYRLYRLRRAPIPQEQYYSLWVVPVPSAPPPPAPPSGRRLPWST